MPCPVLSGTILGLSGTNGGYGPTRFEEALEERPMKMAGAEEGGGDVLKTGGAAQVT